MYYSECDRKPTNFRDNPNQDCGYFLHKTQTQIERSVARYELRGKRTILLGALIESFSTKNIEHVPSNSIAPLRSKNPDTPVEITGRRNQDNRDGETKHDITRRKRMLAGRLF